MREMWGLKIEKGVPANRDRPYDFSLFSYYFINTILPVAVKSPALRR